jgi:hypothetical protein
MAIYCIITKDKDSKQKKIRKYFYSFDYKGKKYTSACYDDYYPAMIDEAEHILTLAYPELFGGENAPIQ